MILTTHTFKSIIINPLIFQRSSSEWHPDVIQVHEVDLLQISLMMIICVLNV